MKNRVSQVQMLIPGETFSESYPARPESVGPARNALTTFAQGAGADSDTLDTIRLAASEAVTNAVMHAYDEGEQGTFQISASYVENELWMLIADTGKGLRPRSNSPGLGLGLALIAQLADEFQILSRGSGGTELRLRFKLAVRRPTADRSDRSRGCAPTRRQARGSVSAALSPA